MQSASTQTAGSSKGLVFRLRPGGSRRGRKLTVQHPLLSDLALSESARPFTAKQIGVSDVETR